MGEEALLLTARKKYQVLLNRSIASDIEWSAIPAIE
ncbi:tail fiber assembly protein [Escherichia sp. E1130]|nr:hypothetical protein [Escherichia sp. E1130]TLI63843.1 tail fiber assembly protein [Escherichia sp. E1130]